ncbi:zinc finger protein 761-like [Oppia nitens]|uniref:zinc finger protein 761-like n=1 Tax=Oppia nitens TaxID=1686743 RepID=UPI0023DC5019|nr:zinc finger protein 761-like [Oppia nitens]
MATTITVKDLFDELSKENRRLIGELGFCHRYVQLCDRYRLLAINFRDRCICDQNVGNESKLNNLDLVYGRLLEDSRKWLTIRRKRTANDRQTISGQLIGATGGDDDYDGEELPVKHKEEVVDNAYDSEDNWQQTGDEDNFVDNSDTSGEEEEEEEDCYDPEFKPNRSQIRSIKSTILPTEVKVKPLRTTSTTKKRPPPKIYTCETCGKTFQHRYRHNNHVLKQHSGGGGGDDNEGNDNHNDDEFFKKINTMSRKTSMKRPPPKIYTCETCGKTFQHKYRHENHVLKQHSGVGGGSSDDNYSNNNDDDFMGGRDDFDDNDSDSLMDNKKKVDTSELFKKMNTIHKWKSNRSPTSKKKTSMIMKKKKRVSLSYTCQTCGKTFAHKYRLRKHEEKLHGDEYFSRPFVCSVPGCKRRFRVKKSLYNHHREDHSGGDSTEFQYRCPRDGCTVVFKTKSGFNRHMELHDSAKKTYGRTQCLWPGCSFVGFPKTLEIHLNRHQGIKPYACDDSSGCQMSFYSAYDLKQHRKQEHEPKPPEVAAAAEAAANSYRCDIEGCDRSYDTPRQLKLHKRQHDRIYKCSWPECDQTYYNSVTMRDHMDRHLNVQRHKCQFCQRGFFTRNNCLAHMNRIHQFIPPKIRRPYNLKRLRQQQQQNDNNVDNITNDNNNNNDNITNENNNNDNITNNDNNNQ